VNDETMARFIERSENKFFGKYRGFVQDRNDPGKLGRLRLKVPSLLGDAQTGWAWPALPYAGANLGFFFVPQVGDLVWVEFVEGDLEHPIWSGGGWAQPSGESEIPDDAKASYPDAQVLRTKSGHVIILDDSQGGEKITIRAKNGCEITIDPNAPLINVVCDHVTIQSQNGTAQELATKDFVEQLYNKHHHPSGVGPTGPPIEQSPTVPTALTSVLKAQ
jgi:uncharacterized protein involved in type VI secretion and phage assembly